MAATAYCLLLLVSGFGFDGSMRTTVPSTRCSRAPVQSATLHLPYVSDIYDFPWKIGRIDGQNPVPGGGGNLDHKFWIKNSEKAFRFRELT